MKTLIIYHSSYMGNTERVARAIADGLGADIITVDQADSIDIAGYDLIGLGSPINFGSHDKQLLEYTSSIDLSGHRIFIFSTRCSPILGSYHRTLNKIIKNQGGTVIAQFSCRGYDNTGPWTLIGGMNKGRPDDRDIFKARLFGFKLKRRENSLSTIWSKPIKTVTDGIIYRDLDTHIVAGKNIVYIDTTSCVTCGQCIKNCPMGIFKITTKPENINPSARPINIVVPQSERDCILCHQCDDRCPANAIYIRETTSTALRVAFTEKRLRQVYLKS